MFLDTLSELGSNFSIRWGRVLWFTILCFVGFMNIGWWGPALVVLASVDLSITL